MILLRIAFISRISQSFTHFFYSFFFSPDANQRVYINFREYANAFCCEMAADSCSNEIRLSPMSSSAKMSVQWQRPRLEPRISKGRRRIVCKRASRNKTKHTKKVLQNVRKTPSKAPLECEVAPKADREASSGNGKIPHRARMKVTEDHKPWMMKKK